jgi:hypothetical protein
MTVCPGMYVYRALCKISLYSALPPRTPDGTFPGPGIPQLQLLLSVPIVSLQFIVFPPCRYPAMPASLLEPASANRVLPTLLTYLKPHWFRTTSIHNYPGSAPLFRQTAPVLHRLPKPLPLLCQSPPIPHHFPLKLLRFNTTLPPNRSECARVSQILASAVPSPPILHRFHLKLLRFCTTFPTNRSGSAPVPQILASALPKPSDSAPVSSQTAPIPHHFAPEPFPIPKLRLTPLCHQALPHHAKGPAIHRAPNKCLKHMFLFTQHLSCCLCCYHAVAYPGTYLNLIMYLTRH